MSEIYRHALAAVHDRLTEDDPGAAAEFMQKTTPEALRDPSNMLLAHINWPTFPDAGSDVGIKANFPGEYEGVGHLDIRFSLAEPIIGEEASLRTDLQIMYGAGPEGIEPLGATVKECFEAPWGETQDIIRPITADNAAIILGKFGILPLE